jgi:O-antigen/teichoic acid export membrane protein
LFLFTATTEFVRLIIPPLVSQLYTENRNSEVEKVLRSTATIAGVPSLIALLFVILFGKSVLLYLYGNHYAIGYATLLVLSGAHMINILTGTPGVLLVMASKEKFLLVAAVISGLLGISISISLVKSMGYLGVAIGAGVGIVVQNLMMAGYCFQVMSINTFMSIREIYIITQKAKDAVVTFKNQLSLAVSTNGKAG